MLKNKIVPIITAIILIFSCTQKPKKKPNRSDAKTPSTPKPLIQPIDPNTLESIIKKSLLTNADSNNNVRSTSITFKKENLNKEFILSGISVFQTYAPEFRHFVSKIIVFKRIDNDILMMFKTDDTQSVDISVLKQDQFITKSKILKEDDKTLAFDFKDQDLNLVNLWTWGMDAEIQGTTSPSTTSKNASYITGVKTTDDLSHYTIQIIANVLEHYALLYNSVTPFEITYTIKKYIPSKNYTKKEMSKHNFRYFPTILPKKGGGDSINLANRHNPNNKITYYYSHTTPQKYETIIKKSVEYWNKAFGKQMVTALKADPKKNIFEYKNFFHWVENKSAGAAYAHWTADPRTGEILASGVFFGSAWSMSQTQLAQYALKEELLPPQSQFTARSSSLKTIKSCAILKKRKKQTSEGFLLNITESSTDLDLYKKAQEAIIATVVAHEIGHALGLMHNFSSHLYQYNSEKFTAHKGLDKYTQDDKEIFKTFLSQKKITTDPSWVSSSVMDYQTTIDSILIGSYILNDGDALLYDKKAIQYLYSDSKDRSELDKIFFCTHQHMLTRGDCSQSDGNPSPFYTYKQAVNNLNFSNEKNFAKKILSVFVDAKYPQQGHQKINFKNLDLSGMVPGIDRSRYNLVQTLKNKYIGKSAFTAVLNKFPNYNFLNEDKKTEYNLRYLTGSYTKNLNPLKQEIVDTLYPSGQDCTTISLPSESFFLLIKNMMNPEVPIFLNPYFGPQDPRKYLTESEYLNELDFTIPPGSYFYFDASEVYKEFKRLIELNGKLYTFDAYGQKMTTVTFTDPELTYIKEYLGLEIGESTHTKCFSIAQQQGQQQGQRQGQRQGQN